MPFRLAVGPASVAVYLADYLPELSLPEIEADIRAHPHLYYSDYLAYCRHGSDKPLPQGVWVDLCRS